MNLSKDIPIPVIQKAQGLIDLYGVNIEHIGKYKGFDVYEFILPENTETGYPFVYLYDIRNNAVTEITDFEALDIINNVLFTLG